MSALPPIDLSQMPSDVRSAGTKAQQLYATALQFEQLLLQQLTQQLDQTTQDGSSDGSSDGSGDGSSDGTTQLYSQMLPGAFAQGITDAGGIGLARQLYDSLQTAALPAQPTQPAQTDAPAPSAAGPVAPTAPATAPKGAQ
jgi:Rod binding domain-containing protein